jgi:hypothetical protein
MKTLGQAAQAAVWRISAAYTLQSLARELELRSSVHDADAHALCWHARWYAEHNPDSRDADECQLELMERIEGLNARC